MSETGADLRQILRIHTVHVHVHQVNDEGESVGCLDVVSPLRLLSQDIHLDPGSLVSRGEEALRVGWVTTNVEMRKRATTEASRVLSSRSMGQLDHVMEPEAGINVGIAAIGILETGLLGHNGAR
jgi:hypothetical protein